MTWRQTWTRLGDWLTEAPPVEFTFVFHIGDSTLRCVVSLDGETRVRPQGEYGRTIEFSRFEVHTTAFERDHH